MNTKESRLLIEKDPQLACALAIFSLKNNGEMCRDLVKQGLAQALHYTVDHGVAFLRTAVQLNPEILMSVMNEGWGDMVLKKSPDHNKFKQEVSQSVSNVFLSDLVRLKDPELAGRVLKRFFQGCDGDQVTQSLLNESVTPCAVVQWLNNSRHDGTHVNSAEIKLNVQKKLFRTSRDIGFDWDKTFDRSTLFVRGKSDWNTSIWKIWKTGPLEKQTILSFLVGMGQNTENTVDDAAIKVIEMMLNEGKCFDKQTASTIVRMNAEMSKIWLDFFVDRGDVLPSQIAAMTSRIKIEPNTKALLSSMVAKESIDSIFKEKHSP